MYNMDVPQASMQAMTPALCSQLTSARGVVCHVLVLSHARGGAVSTAADIYHICSM
jgi:hypothetical protein